MTELEKLEKELKTAIEFERTRGFLYGGAYYAHQQHISSLLDKINKLKKIHI